MAQLAIYPSIDCSGIPGGYERYTLDVCGSVDDYYTIYSFLNSTHLAEYNYDDENCAGIPSFL